MTDSLSVVVHVFASHVLMSVSVDETLLPRSVSHQQMIYLRLNSFKYSFLTNIILFNNDYLFAHSFMV